MNHNEKTMYKRKIFTSSLILFLMLSLTNCYFLPFEEKITMPEKSQQQINEDSEVPIDDSQNSSLLDDAIYESGVALSGQVYLLNPGSDSFIRIKPDASDLRNYKIERIPLESEPLLQRASTAQNKILFLLKSIDIVAGVIKSDETEVTYLNDVRPNLNSALISPDEKYAVLYFDLGKVDISTIEVGVSFNEISIVNLEDNTVKSMGLTFNPGFVQFSNDSSKLVLAAMEEVRGAVYNLSTDIISEFNFTNSPEDVDFSTKAIDMVIKPDGTSAYLLRKENSVSNSTTITVVNLTTEVIDETHTVSSRPSSIEISSDGTKLLIIMSGNKKLAYMNTTSFATTYHTFSNSINEAVSALGSSAAVVFDNDTGLEEVHVIADIATETVTKLPLVKAVKSASFNQTGSMVALLHHLSDYQPVSTEDGIFDERDGITFLKIGESNGYKLQLASEPVSVAYSDDSKYAVVVEKDSTQIKIYNSVTNTNDEIQLNSNGVAASFIPGTHIFYITQAHHLGRVWLIDAENLTRIGKITGYDFTSNE